jgi:hypothetical protein
MIRIVMNASVKVNEIEDNPCPRFTFLDFGQSRTGESHDRHHVQAAQAGCALR